MSRFDADLIIAGAGCAGLSTLWHVLRSSASDRRIIVVDHDFEPGDDRTWGFWGTAASPFAQLADRRWEQLCVRFPGWEAHGRLQPARCGSGTAPRTYMRVRRRAYDQYVLDEARDRDNVRFVAGSITGIRDDPDAGVVTLADGELRAPVVLQSVQLSPTDRTATVRHPLRQHFGGWEVQTEHPVFDPQVATLMDFDTDQHDGTAFFYVLPEAPDRALVEHTLFSLQPRAQAFYDDHVGAYLDQLGAGRFTVTRTEYGTIPMEDRRIGQRWGHHVWNLGAVGGMTKPTTGYTFQRIHRQVAHLVSAWASDGRPSPLPDAPARYRLADSALLNILHHRPELGRPIFERLFRTATIDEVLTFLDEDTKVLGDVRMMARLPWWPFLRAGASELAANVAVSGRQRLAA
jgi:lycopene beta-cyclase